MKHLLTLVFALLLYPDQAYAQYEDVVSELFAGQKITGIDASGSFNITIRQGSQTGVKVTIPYELKDKTVLELQDNGTVKLGFKDIKKNYRFPDDIIAEITCSSLEFIQLTGTCKLTLPSRINGNKLDLRLSGSSEVEAFEPFNIATNLTTRISGSSKVYMNTIVGSTARLTLSGNSIANLQGSAITMFIEASGMSKMQAEEFIVKDVTVTASGNTVLDVYARLHLNITAAGNARVGYIGTAMVNASSSGMARIMNK